MTRGTVMATGPGRAGTAARWRARCGDDRGNMPMVLLIILIGMALSAVLLPTLITQDRATVFDATRADNLAAAQAGVDAVTGRIRSATTDGQGDPAKLPCAPAADPSTGAPAKPIVGSVASVGNARYSVTIAYYTGDPVANAGQPGMLCVPNAGTYLSTSTVTRVVPSYALITSVGTDGATATNGGSTGRTLVTTYVLQTTNKNLPNGILRITPSGSTNYCMDAGSTSPAPQRPIVLQLCSSTSPPSAQQLFSYRTDLTLQLSTSITGGPDNNGLCLDINLQGSSTPTAGNPIVLAACAVLGKPPYTQQWSFNDYGGFTASIPSSASSGILSSQCINVATQTAGTPVLLANCGGSTTSPTQAWLPDPNVGSGAATPPPATNFQLVNFQQFGRCLDVSGAVPTNNLIAYPCKQNPNATAVKWNQKWNFDPSTGWLFTNDTDNGTKYCAYSQQTEGSQVFITPCSAPAANLLPAQLVWTHPADSVPYPQRYTYVDSSTDAVRCLAIAPVTGVAVANVVVATCNGLSGQKWNGSPNIGAPAFQNTVEGR